MSMSGPGGPRSDDFEDNDRSWRSEAASLDLDAAAELDHAVGG